MDNKKPKILIALKENGQNGGPYISHLRIMNDEYLKNKYDFEALTIPRVRKLFNPIGFFGFVKRIKGSKADIVHIAGLQLDGFILMLACKKAKMKTVLAVHGSSSEAIGINKARRAINGWLENYTIRKASIVYGVSDYVSSWKMCNRYGNYFGTIYNLTDFSPVENCSSIRSELGISNKDIVVVSTGRIIKDKGFDILNSVILKFKDSENIKFIIAGDGQYRSEFQKSIFENGMEKQVFLLGYRSDIGNILKGSDIFVICTKHETLCISLLEAASFSLPMIASNVGGIPEIIDEKCGYLVEAGNVDGFYNAIKELSCDIKKREDFGANASSKIIAKFGHDTIVEKIDRVYQIVLKGGKR